MNNFKIARIFREIAKILQIKGVNVFRVRAYERAAQNIQGLFEDVTNLAKAGRLRDIPGVGCDLEQRILEFIRTGKIKFYTDLKKSIPPGLLTLLNIPSVGPKTAKTLYDKLKIKNIADLELAIKRNKLSGIFGIKEKTISNILKGIEIMKKGSERMTLAKALSVAEDFISALSKLPAVKKICTAGSLRRKKETVRDIDILAVSDAPQTIMGRFTRLPSVKDVLAKGETKASVRTNDFIQIDCRVVEAKSFGAALMYFTGSKNFNIKLRQMAIKKGLKVNEYGVFKNNRYLCGKTEEEVFKTLNLAYIEPELREDNGEIELALKNKLPELVKLVDLKGDLHAHSAWSDGFNSIEEIAVAAKALGYSYIAITDHSQSLKIAGGLKLADLKKKKSEIERLNKKIRNFRVLYATEADIDNSGKIDYKDAVLKEFDLVLAAIHTGFKQSKEQLTRRIIRACQNKYVHIISHPTGKLWGVRDPYDLDLEEIFKAAGDTNTSLEINSFPDRLDLNDLNCRRAKEFKARFAINTDSHETTQLRTAKFGIAVARRGWLTKKDIINTLPLEELLKTIKK